VNVNGTDKPSRVLTFGVTGGEGFGFVGDAVVLWVFGDHEALS
jgi:hypothetical protein